MFGSHLPATKPPVFHRPTSAHRSDPLFTEAGPAITGLIRELLQRIG